MFKTWLKRIILISSVLALSCSDNAEAPPGGKDPPGEPVANKTPPTFDGVTTADLLEDGGVLLTWEEPAQDDETTEQRIVYLAYVGQPGEVDFSRPVAVSPSGADRVGVYGLAQAQEYEFVVRAIDDAGNESDTTKAVTLEIPDTSVPNFAGVRSVKGKSGSELEVTWDAPSDGTPVETYLVYIAPSPMLPFAEEPIEVAGDETSYVVGDLEDATAYHVGVRAVNARGAMDGNRRYKEGSTLDETPPSFVGLEKAVAGGTAVRLTWSPAVDNVTPTSDIVYRIYVGPSEDSIDYSTPWAEVTGVSTHVLTSLDPATSYSISVRAVDAAGNESDTTDAVSVVTGAETDNTPPTFAGVLSVTTLGSSSIQVTWDAATDDLSPQEEIVYDIWRSTEDPLPDATEPDMTSPPGATSFDATDLQPNTFYTFLVRARDIAGLRDSNTVTLTAKTKSDDVAPVFAGVTSVVGTSVSSLEVSWDAASDSSPASELEYRIYLATSSGGQNFAAPSETVVGQLSASFSGLARNTTYFAVVQVVDPDGNLNENMVEVSGSTLPDTTAPVLTSAPSLNAVSETAIGVLWSAATDDSYAGSELSYQVQYRVLGVGSYLNWGGLISGAGALSTTITGLLVGTNYQVQVIPRDPVPNIGAPSPVGSVFTSSDTTPPTFSVTPTLSGLTYLSGSYFNQITVSWSPASDNISPPGNIYYELCYSTVSTGCNAFTAFATTAVGVTNAIVSGFPWGTPYYFRVRAVDQAGNRTMSNVVTDLVPPATFSPPGLSTSGTLVNVSIASATDAVFSNLRYRMEYWSGAWSSTSCAYSWVTGTTTAPAATSSSVPRLFNANYVQVIAIDGFGNQRYSSNWTQLNDATAAAASAVIQPIWTANCQGSGCHGGTGSLYSAWNMTTAFQVPSPGGYGTAAIIANNLSSRMFLRTTGQSGSLMPQGATVPLNSLVCNLERWISAGAPH